MTPTFAFLQSRIAGDPGSPVDKDADYLQLERFTKEPGDGPIKTFTLRGIKDSPPYLHDGRLLTLEDTVEFFNLILGVNLNRQEKSDLVGTSDNYRHGQVGKA